MAFPCPTMSANRQSQLCRQERSMVTKILVAFSMKVWVILSDRPPGLPEVVAEDSRNLKGIVGVKESSNCGLVINCSSGDGVDSVALPPLYFPSGKETHQSPGESSSQTYTEK